MHPFVKIILAESEAARDVARAELHKANNEAGSNGLQNTVAVHWHSAGTRMMATLAAALALGGCGGGADVGGDVYGRRPFDIHVVTAGQPGGSAYAPSGTVQRIVLRAGDDVEFDANEPVVWTLNVGGTSVSGRGVTVIYGDVAITVEEITSSRIWISTATRYPLAAPLSISLVATSTYFDDQVARFDVFLTP